MLEKATNKPDTYPPDLEGGMLRSTTQEQRIQQKRKKEKKENKWRRKGIIELGNTRRRAERDKK